MALSALYVEEPTLDKDWYTEDEYFALEDSSPDRWEFLPDGPLNEAGVSLGHIRAMSGGLPKHSALAMRLGRRLGNALEAAGNQMCEVYGSDLKVRTEDKRITFPDISIVCGRLAYYSGRRDTVTNPIFLAEVLSPSTEGEDRSRKRISYQTIPTLQHYLLLSVNEIKIELYTREEDGWHYEV